MGPEDSEVHLRFMWMNASRRCRKIFEICSTKEKIGHVGASMNRAMCDGMSARDRG